MEQLNTWLKAERGRARMLAQHLSVAPESVTYWALGKKPIPAVHALAIELFTGGEVKRQQICRKWQKFWPELPAPTENNTEAVA